MVYKYEHSLVTSRNIIYYSNVALEWRPAPHTRTHPTDDI